MVEPKVGVWDLGPLQPVSRHISTGQLSPSLPCHVQKRGVCRPGRIIGSKHFRCAMITALTQMHFQRDPTENGYVQALSQRLKMVRRAKNGVCLARIWSKKVRHVEHKAQDRNLDLLEHGDALACILSLIHI